MCRLSVECQLQAFDTDFISEDESRGNPFAFHFRLALVEFIIVNRFRVPEIRKYSFTRYVRANLQN